MRLEFQLSNDEPLKRVILNWTATRFTGLNNTDKTVYVRRGNTDTPGESVGTYDYAIPPAAGEKTGDLVFPTRADQFCFLLKTPITDPSQIVTIIIQDDAN